MCNGFVLTFCPCGLANHGVHLALTGVGAAKNQTSAMLFLFLLYLDYGLCWYCSWRIFINQYANKTPNLLPKKKSGYRANVLQNYFIRHGLSPPPSHVCPQDEDANKECEGRATTLMYCPFDESQTPWPFQWRPDHCTMWLSFLDSCSLSKPYLHIFFSMSYICKHYLFNK